MLKQVSRLNGFQKMLYEQMLLKLLYYFYGIVSYRLLSSALVIFLKGRKMFPCEALSIRGSVGRSVRHFSNTAVMNP